MKLYLVMRIHKPEQAFKSAKPGYVLKWGGDDCWVLFAYRSKKEALKEAKDPNLVLELETSAKEEV
jgi:hypothetical protein